MPTFGLTTGAAPAALTQTVTVPPGAWTGTAFYLQQACFEPVPGGMSFSNALRVQLP